MDLVSVRCTACRQLLLKHEPRAVAPGKWIEIKCRCNAMNYIGGETEAGHAEDDTRGRTGPDDNRTPAMRDER